MTAFSPFDNKDYDNMSLPYAFYEISMANSATATQRCRCGLCSRKT